MCGVAGSILAAPTTGRLTGEERRSRFVQALAGLGGLVALFGVIMILRTEWSEIARPLRVLLLLAATTGFFAGGLAARDRHGWSHVGHALLFLGTVAGCASVFLVGRMYEVDTHDPYGFLYGGAGALAIAFLVRSGPVAALGFVGLLAWLAHEAVFAVDDTIFDEVGVVAAFTALYGIALYGLVAGSARWLEPRGFVRPARYVAFAAIAVGLLPFTFEQAHTLSDVGRALELDRLAFIFGGLVAAAGAGVVAVVVLGRRDRRSAGAEAAVLAAIGGLVVAAALAPDAGGQRFYPLAFTAAVSLLAVGSVVLAIFTGEPWLANAGAALVGVHVIARFFDGGWSLLERGVAFVLAGVAMAVVAGVLGGLARRPARGDPVIRPQ